MKARDKDGHTVLMDAAWGGNLDLVNFLIEKGVDLKASDKYGETILMSAAQGRSLDLVKFLLRKEPMSRIPATTAGRFSCLLPREGT